MDRRNLMKINQQIYLKLSRLRDNAMQLINGPLWSDLDVREIDELKAIVVKLREMIEKRRGTF